MAISLFLMGVWDGFYCGAALSFRCPGSKQDEKEKWMRCTGRRVLYCGGGVLWLLLSSCENVLICVYFDQSSAARGRVQGTRERERKVRKRPVLCPLRRYVCLDLAATQAATPHANCDNFSIYISLLASQLIFKPPHTPTTLWLGTHISYNPGAASRLNEMPFFSTMFFRLDEF